MVQGPHKIDNTCTREDPTLVVLDLEILIVVPEDQCHRAKECLEEVLGT